VNRRDTLSLLFGLYSLSPPGRKPDLRTRCVNHGTFSKDLKVLYFRTSRGVTAPEWREHPQGRPQLAVAELGAGLVIGRDPGTGAWVPQLM
jgi:hypothetical protein